MKLFTFLFSIYLLAISLLPCSDAYNECNTKTNFQVAQKQSHKADYNDVCSPFCICSCCNTIAGFAFHPFKIKDEKYYILQSQKIPVQDFSFLSNYYRNIWQPPKINA